VIRVPSGTHERVTFAHADEQMLSMVRGLEGVVTTLCLGSSSAVALEGPLELVGALRLR
jgi:hypothetical protein